MKIQWGTKQILKISFIIIFLGLLYYLLYRLSFYGHGWIKIFLVLLVFFILIALFKKYFLRLDNFLAGNEAELDVGDTLLDDLPESYIHFPNINLENKGNIDYVLLGPTGIWTIEVKSHIGYINFDGIELKRGGKLFEKDFLKQAYATI
jgi:hypothetical protein